MGLEDAEVDLKLGIMYERLFDYMSDSSTVVIVLVAKTMSDVFIR